MRAYTSFRRALEIGAELIHDRRRMAIYHFSAKVISRGTGRSAVAAAAYRAGSELHDERLDRSHDFSAKADVIHSDVMLAKGAPEAWRDREALWNTVEAAEKRRDAQLAREVEFSIPREMSQAEGVRLARDFVQREFVDRGMVADLNVHWDRAPDGSAKPHAHVMMTMREVRAGEGAGPDRFGPKVRDWNSRNELTGWRERWAEHVNERLAQLGIDARIDHRSYADQGVQLEPQHKIGPAGQRRAERGEAAERAGEHREIARRNGEKIAADPSVALAAITRQQSTFTERDLQAFVFRHTDGADQFREVLAKVQTSKEVVRLGHDGRGRERFTTKDMLAVEQRLEQAGDALANAGRHGVGEGAFREAVQRARAEGMKLGGEQANALHHALEAPDLALVVGYAGTGKSAMLGVAREAWERQGYTVRGAALSGIAAENLEGGSKIGSRTLASYEHAWGRGTDRLTSKDVFVVDEAGMIGSRQMERVLGHVRDAGAKVVLVGDPEQLQAIEAGAAFRALAERHGAAEITEIRRQKDGWQRDATRELATGRTVEALERYAAAGMLLEHASREAAKAALVEGWSTQRATNPDKSQVMLAHTRADAAELNGLARAAMRGAGQLGEDQAVSTGRGERQFAEGDRLMFLRNERSLDVKNGTLGTVKSIEGGRFSVRLDGAEGRRVAFDVKDYADVDHGYAATVHKAQGVTVDRAHVLATPTMDRHMAYVGLTRHREAVAVHYGADDFAKGRTGVAEALGRERAKDTTLDYTRAFAERREIRVPAELTPKRSVFSGLKLRAGEARAPAQGPEERATAVARAVQGFAGALDDQVRMTRRGLPVLEHQRQALEKAHQQLEQAAPGASADLRAAIDRDPRLVPQAARGDLGRTLEAMRQARAERARTAPADKGRSGPEHDRASPSARTPGKERDRGMER